MESARPVYASAEWEQPSQSAPPVSSPHKIPSVSALEPPMNGPPSHAAPSAPAPSVSAASASLASTIAAESQSHDPQTYNTGLFFINNESHIPVTESRDENTASSGVAPAVEQSSDGLAPALGLQEQKDEGVKDTITMADSNIKEGDKVSYQWGDKNLGGTVAEVATSGSVSMETARGNTVTREAEDGDPAIRMERSAGHDVVKNASDVKKDEPGEAHSEAPSAPTKVVGEEKNGEPKTGEKRAAEETSEEKKDEEDDSKKQKTNGEDAAPKKKGRPAKGANGTAAPKKDTKKKPPKKAATESGEPRRSGRVANKS